MGFLSRIFPIHITAEEGGGYLCMNCLICLVSVMICIFNYEEFLCGTFEDCLVFVIFIIAPVVSESLLGNTRITYCNPPKVFGHLFIKSSTILLTLLLREFIFNFDVCCISCKLHGTYSCLHLSKK